MDDTERNAIQSKKIRDKSDWSHAITSVYIDTPTINIQPNQTGTQQQVYYSGGSIGGASTPIRYDEPIHQWVNRGLEGGKQETIGWNTTYS